MMSVTAWTYLLVGASFLLYIVIAIRSRASSTEEFYIAGQHVPPVANGMATAADWMSAASFISMAGIISFSGYDGSVYLMGWTGGTCSWPCCWRRICGNSGSSPCLISSESGITPRRLDWSR